MIWLIAAGLFPLLGYLFGSVPVGYLAGRIHGIDIRQHGSRNVGATNVGRVLGKKWGLSVFALDVLKGSLPVALAGLFLHSRCVSTTCPAITGPALYGLWLIPAFTAVIGHICPVWLKFRGGKGVATSLGVVLAVYPFFTWSGLIGLAVWILVVLITRYVSLGSICAVLTFGASLVVFSVVRGGAWAPRHIWPLLIFGCVMPLLVIARHRANIGRLFAGTEHKIGQRIQEQP